MSTSSQSPLFSHPARFIGREAQITQLTQMIADDNCRLITVVGSGGTGKTRLAQEMMHRNEKQFNGYIYFVSLQTRSSAENLASVIADAIGHSPRGQGVTISQLSSYLNHKECLLILDNFEHMLTSNSLQVIRDLLEAVPQLTILVTSREALTLREEWLLPLRGMRFPDENEYDDIKNYDAIYLFTEYARHTQPDFSLDENLKWIIRICQQVDGLPLALELAASWLRYMTCEQIADEIARDVSALKTTLRDMPERHQSMEAVFDQTWEMLTGIERDTFTKLTVFPDSFERSAALSVSESDLMTLTNLVDKSLLQTDTTGRYRMHELLRQYGDDKLRDSLRTGMRQRFCEYYADFLSDRKEHVIGGRQIDVLQTLETELDNIRTAWRQAIAHKDANFFEKSAQTLSLFYQFTSRFAEGSQMFGQAVQSLNSIKTETAKQALVYLLVDRGWFDIRLGQLDRAESLLFNCIKLYQQLDMSPVRGHGTDPRLPLGVIASIRGQYKQTLTYSNQAYQIAEAHDHFPNLCFAHWLRATAQFAIGRLDEAEQQAQRAYDIAVDNQDQWFMAYCLNTQGNIARALGKFIEAEQHYLESYHIREEFEDPEGMAVALNRLGQIALIQNDVEHAQRYYRRSRTLYQKLHDRGGLADAQIGLGAIALKNGQYAKAQHFLREALMTATDIQHFTMTFKAFIHIADLFHQTGYDERSRHLLHIVQDHPASAQEARDNAKQRLAKLNVQSPVDVEIGDWQSIALTLIDELDKTSGINLPSPQEQLIETLTDRELEVLTLLAQGMSNQEIADELTVVVGTIKAHNHRIYGKLDVKNRTEAVTRARELHLI